jgi:hypothetical protein
LSEFDGKMKTKDWSKLPAVNRKAAPAEYSTTQPPWVDPATFFDQLPIVMKQVPPMPGERLSISYSAACSMRLRRTQKL